jgi:hypothetical protein
MWISRIQVMSISRRWMPGQSEMTKLGFSCVERLDSTTTELVN